ncbi:MAG: hypothetical protein H7Y41_01610, partial [Hyphomonadaceae bacterium]|nr:hypothetical protein [Clostridia bacterium]
MAIVKSYIAETQKQAFDKVKADLGDEAIIINTRRIRRKGWRGFFQKPLIELTAVIDEPYQRTAPPIEKNTVQKDREEMQNIIKESLKNEKLERIEKQMGQVSDMVSKVFQDVDFMKHKELTQYSKQLQAIYKKLIQSDTMEDNALKILKAIQDKMEKENLP